MAKAKGTTLIGAVKFLRTRKDDARRVLAPELHGYLAETIQAASWYPEADLLALVRAVAELVPGRGDEVFEIMGAATARALGEGVYSHLTDGGGTASSAFALWSSMHDTGRLKSTIGDAAMSFELRDYAATSREMCALVGAYIEETMRMGGRSTAIEKTECVLDGADVCRWRAVRTET